MKKIILLVIAVFAFIGVSAQERTVDLGLGNLIDLTKTKNVAYNGTASDRLIPTTRDTIDYYLQISNYPGGAPMHFYAVITLDTIGGADTTVAITVQGKKFANQAYSDIIASALTSAVSAEQQNVKTTLGVTSYLTGTTASATDILKQQVTTNSDTITVAARTYTEVATNALYYKFLKFRLILQGNDFTGVGIRVKRVEIQFF